MVVFDVVVVGEVVVDVEVVVAVFIVLVVFVVVLVVVVIIPKSTKVSLAVEMSETTFVKATSIFACFVAKEVFSDLEQVTDVGVLARAVAMVSTALRSSSEEALERASRAVRNASHDWGMSGGALALLLEVSKI